MTNNMWQAALLVSDGLSNPQIAQRLGISISAAKRRLHVVYKKLGLDQEGVGGDWTARIRLAVIFCELKRTARMLN